MESPQLENGFIRIANKIMDALCKIRIPGEIRQVLDVVLRETYGWNKKSALISISHFVKATNIRQRNVIRSIQTLENMKLIIVDRDTTTVSRLTPPKASRYRFNKDFSTWCTVSSLTRYCVKSDTGDCVKSDIKYCVKSDTVIIKDILKTKQQRQKILVGTPKTEPLFLSDSIEVRLSEFLFKHIQKNNPNAKAPNIQAWAKGIDLMIRIDKRQPDQIKDVIAWCQKDDFWMLNILSVTKLREKYDQLFLKMNKTCGRNEEAEQATEAWIKEHNGH